MNCPACYFDNPTGMSFCGKCAAPLARACTACGFESPPDFEFCGKCGTSLQASGSRVQGSGQASPSQRSPRSYTPKHLADKILQPKSALEGERKQVTLLFAAVKGSMERISRQLSAVSGQRRDA